jgi:chaperone protein EcpD
MLTKQVVCGLAIAVLGAVSTLQAAVQALATRVIYDGSNAAATLNLKNNADQPYMVQTWLEDSQGQPSKNLPMVVVPPLLRIDAGKESVLRFIYAGQGLASDRETLFWINIQEIPPKPKQDNTLQLAIHTRLKLFYRPKHIQTSLEDAVKQLVWSREGQHLKLYNPSPLHVTIGVVKLEGQSQALKNLDADMVAPGQSIQVLKQLPAQTKQLSFSYINDYGGATQVDAVLLK